MQHLVIFLQTTKTLTSLKKKSVYRLFFGVYDIKKIQFFRRHFQTGGQRPLLRSCLQKCLYALLKMMLVGFYAKV